MINSTFSLVKQKIESMPNESMFSINDFLDCGTYKNISVILLRLYQDKKLIRIIDGLYAKPHYSSLINAIVPVSIDAVANKLAEKFSWKIIPDPSTSLSILHYSNNKNENYIYYSSGPYRKYNIDGVEITFKHTNKSMFNNMSYKSCLLVQAIKGIGKNNIRSSHLLSFENYLTKDEIQSLKNECKNVPYWIYECIKSIGEINLKSIKEIEYINENNTSYYIGENDEFGYIINKENDKKYITKTYFSKFSNKINELLNNRYIKNKLLEKPNNNEIFKQLKIKFLSLKETTIYIKKANKNKTIASLQQIINKYLVKPINDLDKNKKTKSNESKINLDKKYKISIPIQDIVSTLLTNGETFKTYINLRTSQLISLNTIYPTDEELHLLEIIKIDKDYLLVNEAIEKDEINIIKDFSLTIKQDNRFKILNQLIATNSSSKQIYDYMNEFNLSLDYLKFKQDYYSNNVLIWLKNNSISLI